MKTWKKRIYQNQNTVLYMQILWVYKTYISFKLISTDAYIVQGLTKLMILNFVVIIKMLKLINSKLTSWRFSISLKTIRKTDISGKTPPPRPGDQSLCGTAETHRGAHPGTCKQPVIDHWLSELQLCVVFSVCLAERVVAKATTEDVACLHMEVLSSAARKSFKAPPSNLCSANRGTWLNQSESCRNQWRKYCYQVAPLVVRDSNWTTD